jgi:hypothetical protein
MLIGIYLWVFILIALRLTNFLTDQRTKFKLFVIAALLCLLFINIETTNNDGRWQPCLKSAQFLKVNNNLKDTCINVKKFATSNVQYSVKELRQRVVFRTEQSASPESLLIFSPILRLIRTGDNIYQWTTKPRDRLKCQGPQLHLLIRRE